MSPEVSVIIPIYNTEATLQRCVDSVLAQTFTDIEIVLVDDGTPDRAGDMADDLAHRYSHITAIHQPNAGLAEARRTGLNGSKGRYIMHLDSDDTLPVDAVGVLHGLITRDNLDLVYGTICRITGNREYVCQRRATGIMSGDDFLDQVLEAGSVYSSCQSISRRELWRDDVFPPADTRLPSEDVYMMVMITRYARWVGVYNQVVYNYYYNPQSLSNVGPLFRQPLWRVFFNRIRDELSQRNLLDRYEPRLRMLEIDHLAFCTAGIDRSDPWYRRVVGYPSAGFPVKIIILQLLLRCPCLMYACIAANRRLKRLLSLTR